MLANAEALNILSGEGQLSCETPLLLKFASLLRRIYLPHRFLA